MKTRRLRLARPRWTLGTMLLVVGWSAVVVWLNVRPRVVWRDTEGELVIGFVRYGCPWSFASVHAFREQQLSSRFHLDYLHDVRRLYANIAIGLLAVAVLTFASKYLARAIVSGVRAFVGKPPPSNGRGPLRACEDV